MPGQQFLLNHYRDIAKRQSIQPECVHASMSSKLHRALQQLHDYRNYFNRQDSAAELQRQFGFAPINPKLAVLIGRRTSDDPDKLSPTLDRYLDIEVLTYDDVLSMEAARLIASRIASRRVNGGRHR